MLQDKTMVNDALSSIKSSLTFYANSIAESENQQLRSTLQQIRNNCEVSQYELFNIANSKGYYKPAIPANNSDVQQVRTQLQG